METLGTIAAALFGALGTAYGSWVTWRAMVEEGRRKREQAEAKARAAQEAEVRAARVGVEEVINRRFEQLMTEHARHAAAQEDRILHLQQRLEQVEKDRQGEREYYLTVLRDRDDRIVILERHVQERNEQADDLQIQMRALEEKFKRCEDALKRYERTDDTRTRINGREFEG